MSKLVNGQVVSIINEFGKEEGGYEMVEVKPDKQGLLSIKKDDTILRIHPKRVVVGERREIPMPKMPVAKPQTSQQKISMEAIAATGELWVRAGIDFNGSIEVNSYCFISPTKGRYLFFNTYDGTYGKKGKQPPVKELVDGQPVGYEVKDIEKVRNKLIKGGYKKFGG